MALKIDPRHVNLIYGLGADLYRETRRYPEAVRL